MMAWSLGAALAVALINWGRADKARAHAERVARSERDLCGRYRRAYTEAAEEVGRLTQAIAGLQS